MNEVRWVKIGTLLSKELADVQAYPTIPVLPLDALEAWLENISARPKAMRALMDARKLVIDNLEDPMQQLALTLYTELCEQAGTADHLLAQVRVWKEQPE